MAAIRRHSFRCSKGLAGRIGAACTELSRTRSPEHDCVVLELVLVAIVLGEPSVEL
uniref:Uncharacterized protein n=1 Tax=Micromonospora carbonacea TaxID=47853 RepID=A0A7D6CBR3_9ACTN|nr:hypothetical protein HZU44_27720 [Micromonospora carbonacea]